MDIAKEPGNELFTLKRGMVFCESCGRSANLLTPLTAAGDIVEEQGATLYGETLGENERFARCGKDLVTGMGNIYKVKFTQTGSVKHVSGSLSRKI